MPILASLCLAWSLTSAHAQLSLETCAAERDRQEVALIGDIEYAGCIADLAAEKKDRSYCDVLAPDGREHCRAHAAMTANANCPIDEDYDRCTMEAAVEFQDVTLCQHGVSKEAAPICTMMVAAEAQDISILFDEPNLKDEERDARAAQFAVLAKDYDALDYINDDETHDLTLIAVTVNRVAAGEPVGPAPCNNLSASSLDSFNRQPFQLDLYAMCIDSIALAGALVASADSLDETDLMELERLISSMDTFDPDTDLSLLPPAVQAAYHDRRARAVSQHNEPAQTNNQNTEVEMPSLATPDYYGEEDLTSDDVCILGQC